MLINIISSASWTLRPPPRFFTVTLTGDTDLRQLHVGHNEVSVVDVRWR